MEVATRDEEQVGGTRDEVARCEERGRGSAVGVIIGGGDEWGCESSDQ